MVILLLLLLELFIWNKKNTINEAWGRWDKSNWWKIREGYEKAREETRKERTRKIGKVEGGGQEDG